jgi:MYXO-CTERM domain-containing protein
MGIDGGGAADGYMTAAASKFHNDPPTLKALPDDGKFAANARHPDVTLHFSNDADAASQQTYWVKGMGTFTFPVPAATYSKMFLFLTSSEGSSALKVTLTYADATTDPSNINLPDYYLDVSPTDPVLFNLASDLPKWTKTNAVAESNHHNLTGVEIHPAVGKVLSSIKVDKGANGYLVFWGATGVATSAVDIGSDAGNVPASEAGATPPDAASMGGGGSIGSGGTAVSSAGGGVVSGSGGTGGSAGSPGAGGSTGGDDATSAASTDAGCGCRVARRSGSVWAIAGWLAVGAALGRRRRPRSGLPSRDGRSLAS